MRALFYPLFARSAWLQAATAETGTTDEGAALASIRSFLVGLVSHCGGGYDCCGRCPGLCSFGQRGLSHPLCWWARLFRALPWPLFAVWEWGQSATVVADTTVEDAALVTVRSVGVVSVSHCGTGTRGEVSIMASDRLVGVGLEMHSGGGHDR